MGRRSTWWARNPDGHCVRWRHSSHNSDLYGQTYRKRSDPASTWLWYRGGGQITGETGNTYTLVQADAGERIRVVVRYQVEGSNAQGRKAPLLDHRTSRAGGPGWGQRRLKFAPAAVSRTISEGAKGRNVGAPVTATGNHGTIRYALPVARDADDNSRSTTKTGQITDQ